MRPPGARTIVTAGLLLVLSGCGGGQRATKSPLATTAPSTEPPTTVPVASVVVTPPSGPVGSSLKLAVTDFQPGENVKFEIDFPNAHKFTGPPHLVGPDGTTSTNYTVTAGNPPGDYVVKALGDKGTMAQSDFKVTGAAGSTATTARSGSSATTTRTTSRTTATTRPATTATTY